MISPDAVSSEVEHFRGKKKYHGEIVMKELLIGPMLDKYAEVES